MRLGKVAQAVLSHLLNKRIFNRHTPEDKLLRRKTKWLKESEKKGFDKEYRWLVNEVIILREKKRTGKGSGWHIRLNPRKLKEAYELIG